MQLIIAIPTRPNGEPILDPNVRVPAYLEDATPVTIASGDIRDLIETITDTNVIDGQKLLAEIARVGVLTVAAQTSDGRLRYLLQAGHHSLAVDDLPPDIAAFAAPEEINPDS
jgi:hypothetical protein